MVLTLDEIKMLIDFFRQFIEINGVKNLLGKIEYYDEEYNILNDEEEICPTNQDPDV